jgi:hypothetical protein
MKAAGKRPFRSGVAQPIISLVGSPPAEKALTWIYHAEQRRLPPVAGNWCLSDHRLSRGVFQHQSLAMPRSTMNCSNAACVSCMGMNSTMVKSPARTFSASLWLDAMRYRRPGPLESRGGS